MNKVYLKKVISIINNSKENEISVEYVCDKLNIQEHEVIEIFELLIDLGKVVNIGSKLNDSIAKKGFIDYQSLSNIPNPNNIIYRLAKNPIIQIMSIIVIIYSFLKIIEVLFSCDIPII